MGASLQAQTSRENEAASERPCLTSTALRCHAQEGTRTPTLLRGLIPETSASTNSATRARRQRFAGASVSVRYAGHEPFEMPAFALAAASPECAASAMTALGAAEPTKAAALVVVGRTKADRNRFDEVEALAPRTTPYRWEAGYGGPAMTRLISRPF